MCILLSVMETFVLLTFEKRSFCKVCILHTETMVHDDLSALLFPILNLPLMLAKGQSEYISSIIGTLYKCTNVLN